MILFFIYKVTPLVYILKYTNYGKEKDCTWYQQMQSAICMKYKKNKKKWIPVLIPVIILLVGFLGVATFWINSVDDKAEDPALTEESPNTDKNIYEPTYITETCYDGSAEVPPVLYAIPFQKTDLYINNKELTNYIEMDDMKAMQERMTQMVTDLMGSDGRKAARDASGFQKKFESYLVSDSEYLDENGTRDTAASLVAKYIKALADAEYNADVTFETDKSLIFSDGSYYMRGLVTLTVYRLSGDADLSSFIPVEIKQGETTQFVIDIPFIYGNEERTPDDIRICGIENMKVIGKEE